MNKISENKINEIIADLNVYKTLDNEKHKAGYYYTAYQNVINSDYPDELKAKFIEAYNQCKVKKSKKESIDTDDRAITNVERDENGLISYYTFEIYRKYKNPIIGKFSREEMNLVYRLYSYYGDSLTQRVISRNFPEYSLVDFKRILRCFQITKGSAPFAPHMFEELSEEELRNIQLREKENSFLRKVESDIIKNNEKLLKQYANENIELKRKLESLESFKIILDDSIKSINLNYAKNKSNSDINLYISDIHLGATVTTGSLYKENESYGFDEAKRRLEYILYKIKEIGPYNCINLVLMGDNIDCCGFTGKTARLDHIMPENMDAREQANKYINLMLWFVESIVNTKELYSKINVYSVPCGNHGGNFEYICNKALLSTINVKFPEIETTLWEEFYGIFELNNHTFICLHGKEDQYMKKGFPLNLNDSTKVLLYEWIAENNIKSKNPIHFIKGDLHSDALNSCKLIDYRNVLSLFGASDYSNYNFSRNSYGMSYDLFLGDNLIRGTFNNI